MSQKMRVNVLDDKKINSLQRVHLLSIGVRTAREDDDMTDESKDAS